MKTVAEYMDDLKEKTGSDYKSAQVMDVQKTTISNIRKRGLMSDETAIKVADTLGIDRGEVLLAAAMARSEGETRSAWEALTKRLSAAAVLLLLVTAFPQEARAAGLNDNCLNIHYAKSWEEDLSGCKNRINQPGAKVREDSRVS